MQTRAQSRSEWDYLLMMLTMGLLGALGAQSFIGTLYAWWGYRTQPAFEQVGYPAFIEVMNLIAAPLVVALIVVMGLCVPKRLFSRRALVIVSVAMVLAGAAVGVFERSLTSGLTVYLTLAALIQVAVVVLTLSGARGLAYLSTSRIAKAGSGLLHLGFVLVALVVAGLQDSPLMLPVFGVASLLVTAGMLMAFYARPDATGYGEDESADPEGGEVETAADSPSDPDDAEPARADGPAEKPPAL